MQLDLLYVQLYHDCRITALPVYGYATLLKILVVAPLSQAVQRVNATTCNTTTTTTTNDTSNIFTFTKTFRFSW